jgi:hypothetical protein
MGLFSFGGSASAQKGSSTSTVNTTTTQTGTSSTSGSGTTQTQQTSFDAASKALLDKLTQSLSAQQGTGGTGYSKQDAVVDAQGTIDAIFRNYRENDLPQIVSAMGAAGAYNSTGAQALANDAYAEAVAKSSTAVLQTIKDYAGISRENEQLFMTGLLGALGLQSEATKSATTTEQAQSSSTSNITETSSSTATEKSKSKSGSLGFKFG